MWSFDDKKRDFLPVREGTDQGGGQERVMLNAVGGANGIRRREEDNFDGTTTTLYTRNGRPVFETTEPVRSGSARVRRGFLVKDPQSGYAVLFNPYTLEVEQKKYVPALNTYSVQDFNTRWNVLSSDTTHWADVVMFDGTLVKVNARHMSSLMTKADHGFQAIPFVIDTNDDENRYGSRELNTTKKRVFAVGRDQVKSWGGAGVTETLTPLTPRAEGRAMTIGQRIDAATNKAFFGQLFHTAMAWDDIGGGWGFSSAEVAMLLTPPYLSKISSSSNVEMTVLPIESAGPQTSGSMDTAITLPETPVALTATGAITQSFTYDESGGVGVWVIYWTWNGIVQKQLDGDVHANYLRLTYSGEDTYSATQGGYLIEYSASNIKNWDTRSELTYVDSQTVQLVDTHTDTMNSAGLGASATALYWSTNTSYKTYQTVPPTRGNYERFLFRHPIGTGGVPRDYEVQNGTFSVTGNSHELVFVEFIREHSTGQKEVPVPNATYYDIYIGQQSYAGPSGMGLNGRAQLDYVWHAGSDTIEINRYKLLSVTPRVQDPAAIAEINQEYQGMASALAAQTYLDNENAYTYNRQFYFRTIANDVTQDTRSLTWRTKDFILHDATNGVYISVEGSFAGSGHPATATLSVSLKVQTRYHTNTIALGEWSYIYSDLLPEKIFDEDNGLWAVPSPQIRAIFAPLYQEQGSFKGAHYVTAAEEANGALPFHGFNFVLVLQPYDAVSSCNDDNLGTQVFMVPCNLLEMLYAFVFSQEYGVSQYERYPVSFLQRYTDIMSGASALFNVARRVQIRDGVVSNWVGNLGTVYANTPTTELYRT